MSAARSLPAVTLGAVQGFQDSLAALVTATQARRLSAVKSLLSFFYLKSHGGDAWKDKQTLEHTGPDGTPLSPANLVVTFMRDQTG